MKSRITLKPKEAKIIAKEINQNGYGFIPQSVYFDDSESAELNKILSSYFLLPPDAKGGRRYRAFKNMLYKNKRVEIQHSQTYQQSKEYNPDLGGVVRSMAPIEESILANPLFSKVLYTDLEIAKKMEILDFEKVIKLGIHQVRYAPVNSEISYSSPPGLHRDDEDIVFIHIGSVSNNLVGGENVICEGPHLKASVNGNCPFLAHTTLSVPLEALCVTKKYYHQVYPMSSANGKLAYRDILLVTFQYDEN